MLKTFDLVLIGVMTATAAVTYTIKHRAELKLEEVHRLEAEIKLEKDTIDLLKADWALQSQPNRLERLVNAYNAELQLQPTDSTALVHAKELPMLKSEVPVPDVTEAKAGAKGAAVASAKGTTGKAQPVPMPRGAVQQHGAAEQRDAAEQRGVVADEADEIETGSVE
ncbi:MULTISPECIES: cell division protein FtsL [Rhizobium]|uniref:cell division protein FtsL n=1 Tax=Rhizobium TaxID=379 RepID=UPI0007EB5E36|nr:MULTISPECIES: hypothetical protein [Rhizobium]ANK92426.1 hypothetical protein AMK01_CH02989 [Rhizobium sp. N6212]ANK98466.1 hypothetical protein AMK00_CH02992 [Rhizobium sp. N621]ANL04545.1 hypothetical protein AMJ99_CH03019 [Rhizobium esperanzae]ANL10658.1 hypothetical protein AMJ98_CH03020 [Rhizobium sp. N1341]ANL22710.1 hypothetical protein AMJ96_CH03022 [Rhizobium sp. N113]